MKIVTFKTSNCKQIFFFVLLCLNFFTLSHAQLLSGSHDRLYTNRNWVNVNADGSGDAAGIIFDRKNSAIKLQYWKNENKFLFSSALDIKGMLQIHTAGTGNQHGRLQIYSTINGSKKFWDITNKFDEGQDLLFRRGGTWEVLMSFDYSNQNVGIGKTNATKKLDVNGDINFTGDLYKNGTLWNGGGTGDVVDRKIVVQNYQNGGTGRGIYMWHASDSNWGIYMGISGSGKSLSGGTAPSSGRITHEAIRFRAFDDANSNRGFIFENHNNEVLASINSSDGLARFKTITVDKVDYNSDDVRLGTNAGKGVTASGKHVFIGSGAGSKAGFDEIALIDYEDGENTNPVTGDEYLQKHSVFVLNNHEDLNKPLLFGNFAKHDDPNSMAQLAINTHHVIDSVALTISGAVHIGPKNIDPTVFPSRGGYDDALLWVEKGIVTEDVTYAFTSNWNDWPDYVFDEDYDLMELNELDAYIREEKHLPGIVSRDEVEKEGLKSREMIANLLLKIEELTLYTISQEKKID